MAAAATVEIILKARDETKGAIESATSGLEAMGKSATAASLVFGGLAVAGAGIISTFTMTAARTEELGVVVASLGRVAGISQSALDATEESIKDLGITTQSARTIMARFIGAELDLADATNIARAAQDLAVIGMVDSSEAASDLTYALVAMQPRLLRKYGIYVSLVEVYKKAAEALDKEVADLTEAEKRHAFLNATLEAAAAYTGTYEAAMTTAGKQQRSFSRYTEELANQFGEHFLPIFGEAISMATEFVKGLIAMPGPAKEIAMQILAFGTVMAGAVAGAAVLTLALPFLASALAFLLGPIGLIAVAIGALAAAWIMNLGGIREVTETVFARIQEVIQTALGVVVPFIQEQVGIVVAWFQEKWPLIQQTTETVFSTIQTVVETALSAVQAIVESVLEGIRAFWESHGTEILAEAEAVWQGVLNVVQTIIPPIRAFIEEQIGNITAWVQENLPLIRETWETVLNAVQSTTETVLNVVWTVIQTVLNQIRVFWNDHGQQIMSIVESTWEIVKTVIDTSINVILGILKAVMQLITGDWEGAWNTIQEIANMVWEAIKRIVDESINIAKNTMNVAMTTIEAMWARIWAAIQTKLGKIWDTMETAVATKMQEIYNTVKDILADIRAFVSGFSLYDVGKALMNSMKEGIKSVARSIAKAVADIVRRAIQAAKDALGWGSSSKVFIELGEISAESFAIGLENMQRQIEATMAKTIMPIPRLAPAMARAGAGRMAAGPTVARPTAAAGHRGRITIEIPIILDGREIARVVDRRLGETLEREGITLSY